MKAETFHISDVRKIALELFQRSKILSPSYTQEEQVRAARNCMASAIISAEEGLLTLREMGYGYDGPAIIAPDPTVTIPTSTVKRG